MNTRGVIALGAVVLLAAAVIALLSTGGPNATGSDSNGDVRVGKGRKPPKEVRIADIVNASVIKEGDEIVFQAELDGDVPDELDEGLLSYRWNVEEDGRDTWLVTADVTIETHASLVAQQFDYSATTIDQSLPGAVEIDGDVVAVRVDVSELKDFPASFDWSLETVLDGDRSNTASAEATDRVPDEGVIPFDG